MSRWQELSDAYDAVPRPPWPPDWACHSEGCGHRQDEHASPIVENGRCLHPVTGCPCIGWDPLTQEQWDTVYAAQRAGMR